MTCLCYHHTNSSNYNSLPSFILLLIFLALIILPQHVSPFSLNNYKQKKKLALISFDLDDTLFPLKPVLEKANDVMLQAMKEHGAFDTTLEQMTKVTKDIRNNLGGEPITYTDLRIRAIETELLRCWGEQHSTDYNNKNLRDISLRIFDSWLDQRHKGADEHLFQGTIEMLEFISEHHPDAKVAAITNGRGSPQHMPRVSKFFDFTVSGEDRGVFPARKPNAGIYQAALRAADCSHGDKGNINNNNNNVWIHVGDCLVNDVGASVQNGAKAIWVNEDEEEPVVDQFWSTATAQEVHERKQKAEAARKDVSVEIRSVAEIPSVIVKCLL